MKIPKIDYSSNEPLSDLFNRNKDIVFDRFFESIKFGLDNKLTDVYVFELGETGFFLEANIIDWSASLDCCIDYYSVLENYEKCIDCKNLQKKIKEMIQT